MAIQFASAAPKPEPKVEAVKPKKDRAPGAGRPKSDDPKVAITLRLPRSILDRWQRDPDWRARMAALLASEAP